MSPRPEPNLVPTDPPTFDAAGNPRFKRLKLDPDLHDGQNWTIHDVPHQVLLDNIRAWMEEAAPGDGITIKIVEMSDAEAEALPDALHARAREAIARLGLDGSRLETAVAVFGWGSDEANGSLLGLVREAWNDPAVVAWYYKSESWPGWSCSCRVSLRRTQRAQSETEALVIALEATP